jgi:hypothetical protein
MCKGDCSAMLLGMGWLAQLGALATAGQTGWSSSGCLEHGQPHVARGKVARGTTCRGGNYADQTAASSRPTSRQAQRQGSSTSATRSTAILATYQPWMQFRNASGVLNISNVRTVFWVWDGRRSNGPPGR